MGIELLSEEEKKSFKTKVSRLKREQGKFEKKYGKGSSDALDEDEENRRPFGYLQLGFEFAFSILLFLFGGYYLDRYISTSPLFLFLGLVFGFIIGLHRLIHHGK